jgi:hypothetical protein
MKQNKPSKLSRTILLLASAALTNTSQQTNWTRPWFLESSMSIMDQSKTICLHTAQWHIWLQCHANGTTRNTSPSTWKTKCVGIMGTAWGRGLVFSMLDQPRSITDVTPFMSSNWTNSECIGDTVAFFPTHTTMPAQSSVDAAMQAAKDLIHALRNVTIQIFLQLNGGTVARDSGCHHFTMPSPVLSKWFSDTVAWVILSWQNISFNEKCPWEIGFLGVTFWWKSTFPAVGICHHHFLSTAFKAAYNIS